MIAPVRRTTPRKSLEVIYDILPLDLQGQLEAISAQKRNARILKLKWIGHNPSKKTGEIARLIHINTLYTKISDGRLTVFHMIQ